MQTATLTFENMGRKADRTLGIVLFAKHVKHETMGLLLFSLLEATLRSLLKSVSGNELLNSLSEEQAQELTASLREVHAGINSILSKNDMCLLKRKPLFGRLINRIEEQTEDLYDIIENLVLADNSDFRKMVAGCVEKLSIDRSPEPVGHM